MPLNLPYYYGHSGEQYAFFRFITFNPLFASFKKVRYFIAKRKLPNTTLFLFNHHIYFSFLWVLIALFHYYV